MNPEPDEILLQGIVGSTAYGLRGPDSDTDRLGVFAVPTVMWHGLRPPSDEESSIVRANPDITLHEALKFARLALKCNPTILELLWLPDDLYEVRTGWGDYAIEIRHAFLSRRLVKGSYLGFATQQVQRLERRGDGSFASDLRKRTAKHTRHTLRLLHQGLELYQTGDLTVKLANPQWYMDFGERVAADPLGHVEELQQELQKTADAFDEGPCVLPEAPDTGTVDEWLRMVRDHYL